MPVEIKKIAPYTYEIPKEGKMTVPGRIIANDEIISGILNDAKENPAHNPIQQIKNSAVFPGLIKCSLAMPDLHLGYGSVIGGISASDLQEGVISFAFTGFDINCLSADSKVMHEFGYTKKINDFEDTLFDEKIKIFDSGLKSAGLADFQKVKPKKMLKLITQTGREIKATPEHPFYIQSGKKKFSDIIIGEKVLINPFVGVEYAPASEITLLDEAEVKKYCKNKVAEGQIISPLKKLGLLPLTTTNPKIGLLLKIAGFVQGDGNITMTKKVNCVSFYGKKEDLENVQKDLNEVGFAANMFTRKRNHSIMTEYGESAFEYTEYSVSNGSLALCLIMKAIGVTVGNKTEKETFFPAWLKSQPLWMKRLYLAGFFGAEMSTPHALSRAKYNIGQAVVSQNKKMDLRENGRIFLEEISAVLKEFDVESSIIKERVEYINKNSIISVRNRLVVNAVPDNLIKLYSKIGFEYNEKRRQMANYAVQYLLLKQLIVNERMTAEKEAIALAANGLGAERIHSKLKTKYVHVNKRFYERSIYGGRKGNPRVAFNWVGFKEFIEQEKCFEGFVWDKVEKIEEIPIEEFVYDFTVANDQHNFIANSFVVGNCGVHGLIAPITAKEVQEKKKELAEQLFRDVPAGLGIRGKFVLTKSEMDEVLEKGAGFVIEKGYGKKKDLQFIEEKGCIKDADASVVSDKAKERSLDQVGTLGSGNHYCEVQEIEKVYDEKGAKVFGLEEGGTFVSIHCGSRALGHQVGTDYLEILDNAVKKYKIEIAERDLVCAPFQSEEGQKYFGAIKAASNAAFANRWVIGTLVKRSFAKIFGLNENEVKTFYDVGHNTAKIETHKVSQNVGQIENGVENEKLKKQKVLIQRKGSTRGFGPGNLGVPFKYRKVGQPILVGGSMGTNSFILKGTQIAMEKTFGSTIHGAGRSMSRTAALKKWNPQQVLSQLNAKGIIIKARSLKGLPEEAPDAYKDILQVVEIMHKTGISEKVAKLKPMICIKG